MPHDRFYGIAAEELARQEIYKDLFARAYAAALGDSEKTKAIYIGIRAERLEQAAIELAATREKEEKERQKKEKSDARWRFDAESPARKEKPTAAPNPVSPKPTPPAKPVAPPEKPLPKAEDFTDPKMAASVQSMLDALKASRGR